MKFRIVLNSADVMMVDNVLARMAVVLMRDDGQRSINEIRSAVRYRCNGPIQLNYYRMMADICNMRRIYLGGSISGNDFGQYLILRKKAAELRKEQYVPQPQMYLLRKNVPQTYMSCLTAKSRYRSNTGKVFSFIELSQGVIFWLVIIANLINSGSQTESLQLLLSLLFLPLAGSIFSILVGEIFLKRNYRSRFIFNLLLISVAESLAFYLFKPLVWTISAVRKIKKRMVFYDYFQSNKRESPSQVAEHKGGQS